MYTILLNSNKQLITTHREAIIQKSNLVDKIRFLIPTTIGDNEIGDFSAIHVEYVTPVSRTYYNESLTADTEMYDDNHYQYIVPVKTHLTDEAGDIEVQLTFYKVEMTADGEVEGEVFKTTGCTIPILSVKKWLEFQPEKSLLGIDQRILKLLAVEEGIVARQDAIEAYQKNLIDDENISERTTYSSKKIEEKFVDNEEIETELTEREITNDAIDDMFDSNVVDSELSHAEPISNNDIDTLFGKGNSDNQDDKQSSNNTSEEDNISNVSNDSITDISYNEIDELFEEVDDEI